MRRWFGPALAIVAGASLLVWWPRASREREEREHGLFELEREEPGIESEEDPGARARWEELRLRNPRTGRVPEGIRERESNFARSLDLAARDAKRRDPLPWSRRGVFSMGGRTRALALDVADVEYRTLLAGGVSGGVFRSSDGGASWTQTTSPDPMLGATCLAQDRRSGAAATWYYGTGEWIGASASETGATFTGRGIYKSSNGGRDWFGLPATMPGSPTRYDTPFDYVFALATDPSNAEDQEVYAATSGGIYRSLNGGLAWTVVLDARSGNVGYHATDVICATNGVVYASVDEGGSNTGVLRSPDGTHWTAITPPGLDGGFGRIRLALAPSNQNLLYALVSAPGGGAHGLYRYRYLSGDGSGSGGEWVEARETLLDIPVSSDAGNQWDFTTQSGYDMAIAVKPDDEDFVVLGGVHLVRSTDAFATTGQRTWIGGWLYPNGLASVHHADQHEVLFHPADPRIAWSGSDGGVWRTDDVTAPQVEWTSLNRGYSTQQFYTLALDGGTPGSRVLVGGLQDNGTWRNGSSADSGEWASIFGGDGAYAAIANGATAGGRYYVSAQLGLVYMVELAADGSFTPRSTRVDPAGVSRSEYLFINPFLLDPIDSRIMYLATTAGVWRNHNLLELPLQSQRAQTVNWTHLTNGGYVSALAVSESPANLLYYGTADGFAFRVASANTAPAGTQPVAISDAAFPANGYVTSIAVDPRDGQRVLLAFSNYESPSLFYSTNGGEGWLDVEGNLAGPDGPSARSVSILPRGDETTYFVGTSTGLYSAGSLTANTQWEREGAQEIGTLVVDAVVSRASDGFVAAASHGGGAFTASASTEEPCQTVSGDANGDARVDVTDIVLVVNHILALSQLSPGAQVCTNMNSDAQIDIRDIVLMVNAILGGRDGEERTLAASDPWWDAEFDSSTGTEGRLRWHLHAAPAGFQVDLRLPDGYKCAGAPQLVGETAGRLLVSSEVDGLVRLLAYPSRREAEDRASNGESVVTVEFALAPEASEPSPRGSATVEVVRALGSDPSGRTVSIRTTPGSPPDARDPEVSVSSAEPALVVLTTPNPARRSATIAAELPEARPVRIEVVDLIGRRLRTAEVAASVTRLRWTWDGTDDAGRRLPRGVYLVRVRAGQAAGDVRVNWMPE